MSSTNYNVSDRQEKITDFKNNAAVFMSNVAGNPIYTLIAAFLLMFYTDYIGLPAAACGGVILVSKIFDGITDLIAGNIVDRTHTKSGSARPWILRAGIPLGLSFVLLLAVPPIPQIGQLIYVFFSYNLASSVIYTMYCASIMALPMYITDNSKKRSTLYVTYILAGSLMCGFVGSGMIKLVVLFGNDQRAWIITGIILGLFTMISAWISYALSRETVVVSKGKEEDVPFWTGVKATISNKYLWMVVGINLLNNFLSTAVMTGGAYFAKYVLNDLNLSGIMLLLFALPGVPFLLILPKLMGKFTKRNILFVDGVLMIIGWAVMLFVPVGTSVYISLVVVGIGYGLMCSLQNGMLADSVEWTEYKKGVRPQAMVTSFSTVATKVGSGLATAVLSAYMTASNFDVDPMSSTAVSAIYNTFVYAPLAIIALVLITLLFYDLDKKYAGLVAENKSRRASRDAKQ